MGLEVGHLGGGTDVVKVPHALSPLSFPPSLVASQPAVAASFPGSHLDRKSTQFPRTRSVERSDWPCSRAETPPDQLLCARRCGPSMSRLGPLLIPGLRVCVGKGGGCTEGGAEQTEPIQVC